MGYSFRNIVKLFYNTGDSFQTSRHCGPVGNHHSAPRRVTEEHLYQEHVDVCWRVKCAAVWYSGDAAGPSCSAASEQGGFNPGCLRRSLFKYETPVTVHAGTSLLITSEGFLQKMRLLVLLVRLQINSYLFLVSFSRSVTQLNTQLSCFSFCSFSSLSMFVGLFPVEALCLLLPCPLLLLSSRLSLASLARPSFSRPTRTNLMGDKSEWLTMIKKHGGKSAMEPRGNGNLVFNGSSNPKNLQANRWVLHFTSKSRSRQMYRSEFLKKTTLTVAARPQTLSSPSDCDHTGQTEAVVSPLL